MPPRFAYWTILAGGLPTAFRAADREDLLPTLRTLQETHADAVLRWFARGTLWESPEASLRPGGTPRRGRDWRPGGDHQDPRQSFKDAQREKNQALRKERFRRRQQDATTAESASRPQVPPAGSPKSTTLRRRS